MQDIAEIQIKGFDPERPPRIQRMPCIDLFLELVEPAPPAWCHAFNNATVKFPFTTRVDPLEGTFIESWVRVSKDVPAMVERIKAAVTLANEDYRKQVMASRQTGPAEDTVVKISPAQQELNDIIARLEFADAP